MHLLIGPPGPGGTYSNANGSIAGNGPHNPFLERTAQFFIAAPNIYAITKIVGVTFNFGTTSTADTRITAVTPEPSAQLLLGLGTLAGS